MSRCGRRDFLRRTALVSAGTMAWPLVSRAAGATVRPVVVHAHHARAATWPQTTGMYRDYVDRGSVSLLLEQAVVALKGAGPDEAWRRVFPLEAPETRKLSIKISCNNGTDPVDGAGNVIDAIPEPVIAVIDGFVRAGGRSANVNIYDSTNTAPTRYIGTWFRQRVTAVYPDATFNNGGPSGSCTPRTCVNWDPAWGADRPPDTRLSGSIVNADYVVNVPIVKRHSSANASLGFKNHFGSIDNCDRLHPWVYEDKTAASVLADIMGSPYVPDDPTVKPLYRKTVLTVGDMLYGQPCTNFSASPVPWITWGGEWPNCLIVSDDVVAADSVMIDLLQAEPISGGGCGSIRAWARRYLEFAEAKGEGVYDHVPLPSGARFDPARMTYAKLDYRWLDLWYSGALLTVTKQANGAVVLQWQHYFPGLCQVQRATRPDFADMVVLGASPTGFYIDPKPPEPAFYRIRYGT